MDAQEKAGICVDVEKLREVYKEVGNKMKELEEEVNPHLPMRDIPKSRLKMPPKNQFKKDGTPSALALKYFGEVQGEPGNYTTKYPNGSITKLPCHEPLNTREPMTIANDQDIKKYLMAKHDWRPTFWNFSMITKKVTSPKFHQGGVLCPDLERISWPHIGQLINYLSLKNRKNIIYSPLSDTKRTETGWLSDPRLLSKGRLGAASSGITKPRS